ncbi:MAG: hypothetical protein RL535_1028, partial [Pseudomonadota bacterium]
AKACLNKIDAGSSYSVIPWQMGIVAKLLRILPNTLFDKLLTGRGRKARNSDLIYDRQTKKAP